MIRSGLVSITFRNLKAGEIVGLVSQSGLEGIEWGGDVHVPHGDLRVARDVARLTADTGLRVSAYGSYYRVGEENAFPFESVVATAHELGAPTIRVWAGRRSSADADAAYRALLLDRSRRIADLAMAAGMSVSYEYHGGTLTDTNASAYALMRAVNHPAVKTYWQPPVGGELDYSIEGLTNVLPWLTHVHVFHWLPSQVRHLLEDGDDVWRRYLSVVASVPGEHFAMIEFVKDDATQNFLRDASTLVRWLQSTGVLKLK